MQSVKGQNIWCCSDVFFRNLDILLTDILTSTQTKTLSPTLLPTNHSYVSYWNGSIMIVFMMTHCGELCRLVSVVKGLLRIRCRKNKKKQNKFLFYNVTLTCVLHSQELHYDLILSMANFVVVYGFLLVGRLQPNFFTFV